jgi:hypothetical protein
MGRAPVTCGSDDGHASVGLTAGAPAQDTGPQRGPLRQGEDSSG